MLYRCVLEHYFQSNPIFVDSLNKLNFYPNLLMQAIRQYFSRMQLRTHQRLKKEWKVAQTSFVIGIICLFLCLFVAYRINLSTNGTNNESALWAGLISNTLSIAGWVSCWKPAEFFLYGWWLFANERSMYKRLALCEIVIVTTTTVETGLKS
jgi:hypothetical protein